MNEVIGKEQEETALSTTQAAKDERNAPASRAIRKSAPTGRLESPSGFQRTAAAVRTVVPLLQKVLPLLDGNVASVVANLIAPSFHAPAVDLHPLERAVERLHGDLAAALEKDAQQDVALKRVEGQLEGIQEALERASLEQQATAEQLLKARRSSLLFFLICAGFLVISIGLNAALFLYIKGTLR